MSTLSTPTRTKSEGKTKAGKIRFSREQNCILTLDPSLQKMKNDRSLDEKSVQIRYVNTLKKIKETSLNLGCKVKVESKGFILQGTKEKHSQSQQVFNYNFGKQFNRYFRKKLVQRLDNCTEANRSLHTTMDQEVKEMKDALHINKKTSEQYRDFTSKRMQTYLKGISNEKKKMPFFSKKGLDKTFEKLKVEQELPATARKVSEVLYDTQDDIEPLSPESPSKNTTISQKWAQLIQQFHADIEQFQEICDFFEKIQHQLLRYMPNNHLSNKINNIINQVEHSRAIRRIYDQCNADVSILTPQRILKYLKKEEGILSSMNYIVNVIKLNISAQRRKRFLDLQKTIEKYQGLTVESASIISDRLKTIDSPWIKKKISDTVKVTDTNCRGLDPSYLSFVKQAEQQQFSTINANKNRNIICEILKFQTLLR